MSSSAQEIQQQVMNLYFSAEVKDSDTWQVKWFDILVPARESDDLTEVKAFGTWVEIFQSLGQSRSRLKYEASHVAYQWTLLHCSLSYLCSG